MIVLSIMKSFIGKYIDLNSLIQSTKILSNVIVFNAAHHAILVAHVIYFK